MNIVKEKIKECVAELDPQHRELAEKAMLMAFYGIDSQEIPDGATIISDPHHAVNPFFGLKKDGVQYEASWRRINGPDGSLLFGSVGVVAARRRVAIKDYNPKSNVPQT